MHQKPIVLSPAASKGCIAFFVLFICGILSCFFAPFFMPVVVPIVGQVLVYNQAEVAQATVTEVIATNKSCINGMSIPCTHFMAEVTFNTPTEQVTALLDMGHVSGYNQPVSKADYPPGTTFNIRYNPRNTGQVSYDSLWAIFSIELLMFILPPLLFLLIAVLAIAYRINFFINMVAKPHQLTRDDDDWRSS